VGIRDGRDGKKLVEKFRCNNKLSRLRAANFDVSEPVGQCFDGKKIGEIIFRDNMLGLLMPALFSVISNQGMAR